MKPLLAEISVNGERIAPEAIAAEAQMHPAPHGKPGLAWRAAARALTIRSLLLQEARRQGYTPLPREVAPGQRETEEEALVRAVLEAHVRPAPVTDADLDAEYRARPDRFRAPALYEAAHILLPVGDGNEAAMKAEAEALLSDLARNPAAFPDMARARSACSSAATGGLLGQISAGDTVPEFEAALVGMRPGTILPEPVRSAYGWHIIRLDAKAEGAVLPFERIAAPLRRAMEERAWARAARAYTEGLIAGASIDGITFETAA